MIRIAHFSDLHYGPKNLAEADRCFGYAVDEAVRRGVDVAVVCGDATDHALDVHAPAVERLARQVRRLADHCPVLMLQGTFSHEPPGTLAIFRLLGGRHPVHVADRIAQVALTREGPWLQSEGWRFDEPPSGARALFTCVPTVNKASVAAAVGGIAAGAAVGTELAALLGGFAGVNRTARRQGIATVGVTHGTVSGCITEHGVPMAGFDHEFTTGALFAAQVEAFLVGHIHRHQAWEHEGRRVAYAGSIGRFHHGEIGDKGFLLWTVDAESVEFELVPTPARRTVDLVFDGRPDLEQLEVVARDQALDGAFVRVRWTVAEEDRDSVDRQAIKRVLAAAADVQLEGRIVPLVRSRAEGIARSTSLADKVRTWAQLSAVDEQALLARLERLGCNDPAQIVADVLHQGRVASDVEVPLAGASEPPQCRTANSSSL